MHSATFKQVMCKAIGALTAAPRAGPTGGDGLAFPAGRAILMTFATARNNEETSQGRQASYAGEEASSNPSPTPFLVCSDSVVGCVTGRGLPAVATAGEKTLNVVTHSGESKGAPRK